MQLSEHTTNYLRAEYYIKFVHIHPRPEGQGFSLHVFSKKIFRTKICILETISFRLVFNIEMLYSFNISFIFVFKKNLCDIE